MEKEISTDRMITVNYDVFKALDDPIRGKIVELLNKKQLNVEQIRSRLKKHGYKKSVTTIRHHIEILKDSGLIEITKIEESQGAITKYYGSSIKLLDFSLPSDFDENYSKSNLGNLPNSAAFFSEKNEIINDNYKLKNKELISIIPPIGGG